MTTRLKRCSGQSDRACPPSRIVAAKRPNSAITGSADVHTAARRPCQAWPTEVDRLMEKLGFAFWLKLETYWKRRCDLGEFACLDRGETCTCEAVFYRKRVF